MAYDLDDAGAVVGLEVFGSTTLHTLRQRVSSPRSTTLRSRETCSGTSEQRNRATNGPVFFSTRLSANVRSALARNPNFRFVLAIECVARNRRLITDEKVDAASLEQSIGEDDEIRSRIGAGRRYK